MKHIVLLAALALAASTGANAQQRIDRNQIINSLYQTEATVARLDPIALEAAAAAAAASGGDNAPGPLSDSLSAYPQLSIEINFDRGSARIRPESYHAVGLIADALHTPYLMGQRLVIVGHTDATGGRELNFNLSKQRAASIYDALTTTFNVPAAGLVAIGLGEEQLQDPANPDSGVNRRVQIINLGE
ncbi:OmpA family protein [Acuticoccus yangtzensis]|uniref:OmpA family protein n=1 Tax=Acuticoccus yangtzensis TaxID=1443441 RepID=UPI0009495478|nr:OmpA family protein [Acuticoccus yangtzensis]ORE91987.1 OmpA/MotB domain-containing protein [Stappia sp. 22II-S9-Z10]